MLNLEYVKKTEHFKVYRFCTGAFNRFSKSFAINLLGAINMISLLEC